MKYIKTAIYHLLLAVLSLAICGCVESPQKAKDKKMPVLTKTDLKPETTIGLLADIISPDFVPVQGYAIVGGLNGTGSSECPAQIRMYLSNYIRKNLPDRNPDSFINNRDTAVVFIEGLLPTSQPQGSSFDIKITALGGTQTTSLKGGQVYGAEIRAAGTIGFSSRILGHAKGPVYIDTLDGPPASLTTGYILGGGHIFDQYKSLIVLKEEDYLVAGAIRNKLIERFGDGVARPISPSQIEFIIPEKYKEQKYRFLAIVKAIHLLFDAQQAEKEISEAVNVLNSPGGNKDLAEITLEAIGNPSVKSLDKLLDSPDEEIRLRAARCLINFGRDSGLRTLRQIALDENSVYRIDALRSIMSSARRNDAAALARRLLRDNNQDMRLEAYEQLRKIKDFAIDSEKIGDNFIFEQVVGTSHEMIYVTRSGSPRIALFGGPLQCKKDIFIQSADGTIIIDAQEGQGYVNVMRTIPDKPEIGPVKIKSTYQLSDIIRTLGADPVSKNRQNQLGLAVPYSEIIVLLKDMVEKDALEAQFIAGQMPQISFKK